MSKFKIGDEVIVCSREVANGTAFMPGDKFIVSGITEYGNLLTEHSKSFGMAMPAVNVRLVEDRTNWHPHADVIIAWAKGEKIQYQDRGSITWWDWDATFSPGFSKALGWRIKPDNSEEIDRIKKEIQTHGKA